MENNNNNEKEQVVYVQNDTNTNENSGTTINTGTTIETGTNIEEEKAKNKGGGFGIAAIILGIVSIVLSCIWYISVPAGILGIIFGILGLKTVKRGLSIGGIVTSAIGILLTIVLIIAINNFINSSFLL